MLQRLRRAIWVIIMEQGECSLCKPYFGMGRAYRNIFVRLEYRASPTSFAPPKN